MLIPAAGPVLAVIPARSGSKGLPGKNIRPLAGLPLIAHAIRLAAMCPDIARCIVSTDSDEIAEVARCHGGDAPFLRPEFLATDETPTMPVLRHALQRAEDQEGRRYGSVLLLQPTAPGRLPEDVSTAVRLLASDDRAAGVIAVSEPSFNPRSSCVDVCDRYLKPAFDPAIYGRRQDVPPVFRITGTLYLWRREFLLAAESDRWLEAPHLPLVIPDCRAVDIDTLEDFRLAESLVQSGILTMPWLTAPVRSDVT